MPLIDKRFVRQKMTHEARWCQGHGAEPGSQYLGFGMVYYALVYALRAKVCCVLGSGGGFVPRVLRQAQIDAGIEGKTIVVDADLPSAGWGRPDWTEVDSFFRKTWPKIEWIKQTTDKAVVEFASRSIDFLHIDADHSETWNTFVIYVPKVKVGGIVSIHDTITGGACDAGETAKRIRVMPGWDMLSFDDIGAGIALARRLW